MNFKEWFETKLTVGAYPIKVNTDFNIYDFTDHTIINVSDEFYQEIYIIVREEAEYFWFPMNEKKRDIGLNSVFGAMVIMYQMEQKSNPIYLHCHSGRNRSQIVKACYYFMRTGKQLIEGDEKYINRLHRASTRGYLPPMAEMESFLTKLGKALVEDKMNDRILDDCKKEINNF